MRALNFKSVQKTEEINEQWIKSDTKPFPMRRDVIDWDEITNEKMSLSVSKYVTEIVEKLVNRFCVCVFVEMQP